MPIVLRKFGGPLLVVLALALIELVAAAGWRLPNPSVVLLPLVIASCLLGRLGAGTSAALLSCLYYVYINHSPGTAWLADMAPRGWTSITATVLAVPLTEIVRRWMMGESEERFRTMTDNIAQLAWMGDRDGSVFWYNRRWYEYTGTTPEEMERLGWSRVHHPDHLETAVARMRACLETGDVWEDTFPLRAADGSYRWFLSRAVPVRNRRGSVIRWFGTHTDVSEQMEAERKLQELNQTLEYRVAERTAEAEKRAEQLQRLTVELADAEHRERRRLAQVLHDDLQQLLVAAKIQVAAAIAPEGKSGKKAVAEDLLSQAIDTARSLSRELAPPALYEQGLGPALEWLGHSAAQRYRLNVEVEADPSVQPASERLRIVLFDAVRELILNVVKHGQTDRVRLTLRRIEENLELQVEDFGAGFDPSVVGRGDEAGCGLFATKQRLGLMGAQVEIESSPGQGTRIRIVAPLGNGGPGAPERPGRSAPC